jgi:hypothetical protein
VVQRHVTDRQLGHALIVHARHISAPPPTQREGETQRKRERQRLSA